MRRRSHPRSAACTHADADDNHPWIGDYSGPPWSSGCSSQSHAHRGWAICAWPPGEHRYITQESLASWSMGWTGLRL